MNNTTDPEPGYYKPADKIKEIWEVTCYDKSIFQANNQYEAEVIAYLERIEHKLEKLTQGEKK